MAASRFSLPRHRAHDAGHLIERWTRFCAAHGFELQTLTVVDSYPVIYFRTLEAISPEVPWMYLSAGVHGDEAAPPWALLHWAEANAGILASQPFLIFPLMNPVGLVLNTRMDARGQDLNREFHNLEIPGIASWREEVCKHPIDMSLCLHEDYDAQGSYLYEFAPPRHAIGRKLLQATQAILPIDLRREIDGHPARRGWIHPEGIPEMIGEPEAIALRKVGCPRVLTFETPSEFGLDLRIQAHERFMDACVQHLLQERKAGKYLK